MIFFFFLRGHRGEGDSSTVESGRGVVGCLVGWVEQVQVDKKEIIVAKGRGITVGVTSV